MKSVYVPKEFLTNDDLFASFVAGFGKDVFVEYIWIRPLKGRVSGAVKVVLANAKSDNSEVVNMPTELADGEWQYEDSDYSFTFSDPNFS